MKLISKIPIEIVFLLLLVWQILLTFQGLDLADTGFQLTAFRFIFDDPYSVQYSMMFWLSDVCGSIWMNIWTAGGLHWFRLGWVIIISSTYMLYFALLKPGLGKRNAIIGLAITLVFIVQGGPECLNYDIFSALGYALGVFALFQGLQKNKSGLLLLSGLIFGISVFFKLSNLSALVFFLLIPFSAILNKENLHQLFKKSIFWLAGFAGGMFAILFLIRQVGHLDLFLNNLSFVSAMGNDAQSSHGIKSMLISYMTGYLNAFVSFVVFQIAAWSYLKLSAKFQPLFSEKRHLAILLSISVITVLLTIFLGDVFWSKVRYLFIGVMIFQGIVIAFDKNRRNEIRLLSLAGLILLLIAPMGSDSGLEKSIWGMGILGPMLFALPFDLKKLKKVRIEITSHQASFLKRTLAVVVLCTALVYAGQKTYFDAGSRLGKIFPVDHPQLKYIYTSSQRAKVVNELIHQAFPKIKDKKYLLAFIEIPMVNYLSNKKPFISTSWPKLYYNPQTFRLKLEEALQRRKTFPAIIRQKQNTMIANWPVKPEPDYLKYPTNLSKWPEHGIILNEFIAKNNYQVVWENEMFQLLIRE